MPIKKKTTAAKKPAAKKPAVLGPKAKLMKLLVGTLRNKAKKLGISDVAKRTKENLAQSIMLAEARKKRGTTLGKKATAKRKVSAVATDRQTKGTPNDSIKADNKREALPPGRRVSKSGNVYSERRRDRSDKPGQLAAKFPTTSDYIREIPAFYEYVRGFYDEETGIYPIASPQEIKAAINYYLETTKLKSIEFDSLDRERVRDLLEQ